jgi:hypothetical protein
VGAGKNMVLIGLLAFASFRAGQAADHIAQSALRVVFLQINRWLLDSTLELLETWV